MADPRFAIYDQPAADPAARAAELAALGFDTVVIPLDPELARVAKAAGLNVWVCTVTFPVPRGAGDILAHDVYGIPRMWFRSGSPGLRAMRDRHLDTIREALAVPEVDGFYLDGIRFAAPSSGIETFLTCFRPETGDEARRLGFDFERMREHTRLFGHDVLGTLAGWERLAAPDSRNGVWEQYPGAADWLAFRADFITEFVAENARVARNAGKELGAYLYSPAFSRLVGQDYARLREHLSVVSPMIYRFDGWESVLATEICSLIGRVPVAGEAEEARLVRAVLEFCGLAGESDAESRRQLARGFAPGAVAAETRRAAGLLDAATRLVPIVKIEDDALAETVAGVEAAGAGGVSFFTVGGDRDWAPDAAEASQAAFA
jgi:hypothetical protein